jgi:hypothetical protein
VSDSHTRSAHSLKEIVPMLYMIVEHFRDGNAVPVYRRFRERGRLAPEGLRYVISWVSHDFRRCYQVMECADRALLDEWIANWSDLVDFDVETVMTSADAVAAITPSL